MPFEGDVAGAPGGLGESGLEIASDEGDVAGAPGGLGESGLEITSEQRGSY